MVFGELLSWVLVWGLAGKGDGWPSSVMMVSVASVRERFES